MLSQRTCFLDEIEEQADALRLVTTYYAREGKNLLQEAAALCRPQGNGRLILTGMGTSYYVATAFYKLLADLGKRLPIAFEAGELLHHGLGGIAPDDVIVAISQSGESYEVVRLVEALGEHRVLAITNQSGSALARAAQLTLPICSGHEETISNKSYTNSMAVLLLLAKAIAREDAGQLYASLAHCAAEMDAFLARRTDEIVAAAGFLHEAQFLYFVSRGSAMIAAYQAALTWNEGSHIPTTALPGGSFRHGPFELARAGFHAVFFIPQGASGGLLEEMAYEVAGYGGRVLAFSGRGMRSAENLHVIELAPGEEDLFSLATAVPQELLLARMAQDRGVVAGVFERGGKVTRRE